MTEKDNKEKSDIGIEEEVKEVLRYVSTKTQGKNNADVFELLNRVAALLLINVSLNFKLTEKQMNELICVDLYNVVFEEIKKQQNKDKK